MGNRNTCGFGCLDDERQNTKTPREQFAPKLASPVALQRNSELNKLDESITGKYKKSELDESEIRAHYNRKSTMI